MQALFTPLCNARAGEEGFSEANHWVGLIHPPAADVLLQMIPFCPISWFHLQIHFPQPSSKTRRCLVSEVKPPRGPFAQKKGSKVHLLCLLIPSPTHPPACIHVKWQACVWEICICPWNVVLLERDPTLLEFSQRCTNSKLGPLLEWGGLPSV